jgi:hypothetical protein
MQMVKGFGATGAQIPTGVTSSVASHQALISAAMAKNLTFAMMPLLNPTSIWGNLFASRQIFSAMSGKDAQGLRESFGLGKMSPSGGGAVLAGGTMGMLLALGLTIKGFITAIQQVAKQFDAAAKIYAKSLQSGGLSLAVTTKRSFLAEIIGVSEKEVYQFGKAVGYLNDKVAFSAQTMADSASKLTATSWKWKVAEKDWDALFAKIGSDTSKIPQELASGKSYIAKELAVFWDKFVGLDKDVNKMFGLTGGLSGGESAPSPQAWAKQLPVGQFERMGLVVGGFGTQQSILKESRNYLKTIAYAVTHGAIPRGATTAVSPAQPAL